MTNLARCLASVLLLAVLATSAPATADSQTHRDPRGDVTRLMGRAAPTGGLDDIVRVKNTYASHALRLSMTAVELPRRGWTAFWTVLTQPNGRFYVIAFDLARRTPYLSVTGYDQGERTPSTRRRVQLPPTECPEATATVRDSSALVVVPRRCLGSPRLVRVGGTIQDEQRSRYDDSRRRGESSSMFDAYGPPLARG